MTMLIVRIRLFFAEVLFKLGFTLGGSTFSFPDSNFMLLLGDLLRSGQGARIQQLCCFYEALFVRTTGPGFEFYMLFLGDAFRPDHGP